MTYAGFISASWRTGVQVSLSLLTEGRSKGAAFILSKMFKVYVLYSEAYNKIYVGHSSNLKERLISHNEKATKGYTVKYRPWKVVHTEDLPSKREAILRERELKTARGRKYIWEEIINKK